MDLIRIAEYASLQKWMVVLTSSVATVGPGRACGLPKIGANIDASNFARTHIY